MELRFTIWHADLYTVNSIMILYNQITWHSRDVASSIPKGGHTGNLVFAVGSDAGNRPAGVTHAAADMTVAETIVVMLTNSAPFASAIGVAECKRWQYSSVTTISK